MTYYDETHENYQILYQDYMIYMRKYLDSITQLESELIVNKPIVNKPIVNKSSFSNTVKKIKNILGSK